MLCLAYIRSIKLMKKHAHTLQVCKRYNENNSKTKLPLQLTLSERYVFQEVGKTLPTYIPEIEYNNVMYMYVLHLLIIQMQ